MDAGMRSVAVLVNGPGAGRESAVRAIASTGMKVTLLKDVTPIHTTAAGLLSAAASDTPRF